MARVFKTTYTQNLPANAEIVEKGGVRLARFKNSDGKWEEARISARGDKVTRKNKNWTIEYTDANGKRRRVGGYRDKQASEQKLADLVKQAEREKAGIIDQTAARRSDQLRRPISELVGQYEAHLRSKDASNWHISETLRRLNRVLTECEFKALADLESGPVTHWANDRSAEGMGARTRGTYLSSMKAFSRWCVLSGLIPHDPLTTVTRPNERADVRRQRRALTEEEFTRLLAAARTRQIEEAQVYRRGKRKGETGVNLSDATHKKLEQSGRERALIYHFMVFTGLRVNEVRTLTWGVLDLTDSGGWVTLEAKNAKNRRSEPVPLHEELAHELLAWFDESGRPSRNELVFRVPSDFWRAFDRDLKAAGIEKVDESGRTLDLHALRHTTATWLVKAGVPLKVTQSIMRHSDVKLTLQAYTDPRAFDQFAAINQLPSAGGKQAKAKADGPHSAAAG